MRVSARKFVDDLAQDLRYALRGLLRAPGFAAAVIVTLGLGIGANVAMFGLVDRLMFRPYPYLRDPGAVHRIYAQEWNRGSLVTRSDAEYARYLDLRRESRSFAALAGFAHRTLAVGTGDATRERQVAIVSASFWDFFDARPALGRFFRSSEDETPRGADVAVLGHAFWQSELGGRDVIGEPLQVGNIQATIVGVAPEGFTGVSDTESPAVYIPITTFAGAQANRRNATTYFSAYYWRWMSIMVRRKPGVTVEQASADASRAAVRSWINRRAIEPDIPSVEIAQPKALVSALRVSAGPEPGLEARTALWVSGVAAVVLLIACANVANLLLARALERRREIALRLALGARRGRLTRQTLTESLLLSFVGGAAGLLVAQWAGTAIRSLVVPGEAAPVEVLTDWRTLGVATAVAIATASLTGLTPALLAAREDLAASMRSGVREGKHRRAHTRSALLVVQGALSVVLLVGAGLFVRSLANVRSMRLGFDAGSVLVTQFNARGAALDEGTRSRLGRAMLAAAQSLPGVEYASRAMTVPLLSTYATHLSVPGIDSVDAMGQFTYQATSPDYFRVMGTRILRGRGLAEADDAGAPRVAVVSASMARALWPNQDAVGQRLRIFADTMPWATVVGVAEDIVQDEVTASQRYHYYVPIEQYWPGDGLGLLIRTRGDPAVLAESVRHALQGEVPGESYVTVRPLRELVDGAQRSWRLGATMFSAFGGLALLVAALGLYGGIAFDVTQRSHELGVRAALGARSGDILRLVVGRGMTVTFAGIAIGTALALLASRWVEPLLFRQSATDWTVYGAVGAALLVVALGASASPAVRAARADPNAALRSE